MFKYRQEQRQKMTQRILSQEFRANTLTPAPKFGSPLSSDVMGRETSGSPLSLLWDGPATACVMPSLHGCIRGPFLKYPLI